MAFVMGNSAQVSEFLKAIGVSVSGVQRVIIDIRPDDIVRAYITQVADSKGFDVVLWNGEFQIMTIAKAAENGVYDVTTLADEARKFTKSNNDIDSITDSSAD